MAHVGLDEEAPDGARLEHGKAVQQDTLRYTSKE
jgi:hypothetical protein